METQVTDRRESHAFVVVWFPPDHPRRQVKRLTLADARAYIAENNLEYFAPLIEERTAVITETSTIVWNSADAR